ncbi:hypothetical protein A9P82_05345 [Arachidicoccus ginsenosidimutans]|uniref:TlpA family protein disulfide reductase n=1 Tax=Arachidicoccus sp. BS20 TaxID=1850526 RepID=UPI0007F0E049|nr:TlpA disulfide reductase family protein [Arachidicoccus sp. BS20]ANI88761.1 hypothetical protein A9P82_05345 [Arachidicoccus sp. BS20]
MKKLFLLGGIVTLLATTACKSNNGGSFEVTGKVKTQNGKKIYLREIDFANQATISIDSQDVKSDGSFALKSGSKVTGQHLFLLSVDNGFPFIFINDNDKINIEFDPASPLHPSISGSEVTSKLYAFINKESAKDSVLNAALIQLDSLGKQATTTPAQDSLIGALKKNRDAKIADINSDIKNFVNTSDNALSVFYVLSTMAPNTLAPQDLLPLAQAASNRFKEDGSLAGFASRVKEAATNESNPNASFALLNQQAPDLTMQTPDGKPMKISDFKGKYLLVDFWASWCGPCRGENPNVVKVYNKYKDKNFTILGVSLDNDKDAWIKAIKDDKLSWNHMSDLKQWNSAAVQAYGFQGIPFNVLIDPTGKIIADDLRGDDLDNKLAEVLK